MFSKKTNKYDIVVIGSGFLGLSTAYHLLKETSYKVAIISSSKVKKTSSELCSISFAGSLDNFTRLTHQWGEKKAKDIWKLYHEAYSFSQSFAKKVGKVDSMIGHRLRLVSSEEEKTEVRKACEELNKAGFKTNYLEDFQREFSYLGNQVIAVQNEGQTGGWVNSSSLQSYFHEQIEDRVDFIEAEVKSLNSSSSSVTFNLISGASVKSELAILCCHFETGRLLPNLKDSLVPYQDESFLVSYECKNSLDIPAGLTFSYHHGYIWGCFLPNRQVIIGGARFLRKDAGIGLTKGDSSKKVQNYLLKTFSDLFPSVKDLKIQNNFFGIEINPCDEMPIIGPMFGEDRVLLATGFKGQGLTLGLYFGKCLADLVLNSHNNRLLGLFNPQRFRSL